MTSMVGTAVKFEWIEPYSGGQGIPFTSFELSIYSVSTNSYSTLIPIPIVANNPSLSLEYEIEMSALTDLTDPSGLYKYT